MIYLSFPSISPIFFSIGPLEIRWYSLAYIVGFIFAWRYIKYLSSNKKIYDVKANINEKLVDDLVFYSILGLIIGARIGATVRRRPSKEYFLANSFPDKISAIAALPHTVLTLPKTA